MIHNSLFMTMKFALSIPGTDGTLIPIDSGLPKGVPVGGLSTGVNVIGVFFQIAIVAAVLFAIFLIIRGGLNMITSGGDKERYQHGRERIRYAILGLMVIFLSFFLVNFLGGFFGVQLLNFFVSK